MERPPLAEGVAFWELSLADKLVLLAGAFFGVLCLATLAGYLLFLFWLFLHSHGLL